ncbi:hypothetical protein IWQ48_005016 [Labrenzia sp. EL_13]|nr:hypothetical protein [Labrenzia sp. EL_13]
MNILGAIDKNMSAGQGDMSNLSQLERSFLRERNLCEAELQNTGNQGRSGVRMICKAEG